MYPRITVGGPGFIARPDPITGRIMHAPRVGAPPPVGFTPTSLPYQRYQQVGGTGPPTYSTMDPDHGIQGATPAAAAVAGGGALATLAGVIGGGYGLAQMLGVQFPWETGAGEGFIAPWNRDIVQDENGLWVTRETRPDLFGGAPGTAMMVPGAAMMVPGAVTGPQIVKTWDANGWPFAMDSTGKIHTVKKSGVRVSYKPYKSVVLGKKISIGMAKRAVRKLQSIKDTADAIEKLGGTRVVYRKAK